jgi:DNA (cytosine-5)-methyltransferase 1
MSGKKSKKTQSHDIPILSFFTGLGLLDLGFHQVGLSSIWHNEYSKDFVKGFQSGMESLGISGPESKIQNSNSIIDIGPNQILRQAFGTAGRPDLFGMIGGPPCPDFSVGGKNRGQQGDHGKLSEVYINRIIEIQPQFFLFENVPGLLRTLKHREFLKILMDKLSKHYVLDLKVVNALEYGAPQDRSRVIMVGLQRTWLNKNGRNGKKKTLVENLINGARKGSHDLDLGSGASAHWMPWDKHRLFPDAKTKFNWPGQNSFMEATPKPTGCPEELMVGPLICNEDEIAQLPNGTEGFIPYSERFNTVNEGDDSKKCFKRLHRWRYSPAAAYGNNEVHLHPTQARRLSVREAMRIQTVPDDFILPSDMTLTSKFKTIGNAVPVVLAQAMAASLLDVVDAVTKGKETKHGNL